MKLISNILFIVLSSYISTVVAAAVLVSSGVDIENAKNIFLFILAIYTLGLILFKVNKTRR